MTKTNIERKIDRVQARVDELRAADLIDDQTLSDIADVCEYAESLIKAGKLAFHDSDPRPGEVLRYANDRSVVVTDR